MATIEKVEQIGSDLYIQMTDKTGRTIPIADIPSYIRGHDYLPPSYEIASILKTWVSSGSVDIKALEGQKIDVTVAPETKPIEGGK